jgi:5'-nucleotidase
VDRRHLAPGFAAFTAAVLVALLGLRAAAGPTDETGTVRIQLLGVNDLHGHLEPDGDSGGAAWLDAHFDRAAASAPGRTIRVHAGDMYGASPLISTHFGHASTVDAINRMGFDVGTVGNHEFDQGGGRLIDLLRRVRIPYVSANVVDRAGELELPPYRIVERDGAKVGFLGVTTPTAPRYLLPRLARRFRFLDISDSVNRWVPELRRRGVEAIVVLAHAGAFQTGDRAAGEIVDEARQMSDAVDVIVSGHTHTYLNVRVDGKLVVQSLAYGAAYDRVALTLGRRTGDVVASRADIPRTDHGLAPDPAVAAVVRRYARLVGPVADRVVARARRSLSKERGDLGRVVAAAQRRLARSDLAFVNPGNMRDDLRAGPVTYAELCAIEAYGHPVIKMRLRGRYVAALLRQQWEGRPTRLYASGLRGRRLDPDRLYTVAANELIATGARFSVLRDHGLGKHPVGTDVQALVSYLERYPGALR